METLAQLPLGQTRVVRALKLEAREAAWLRAVGIFEGIAVTPLRRAPFGGPVHLRLSTGAELALDPELAAAIELGAPS